MAYKNEDYSIKEIRFKKVPKKGTFSIHLHSY